MRNAIFNICFRCHYPEGNFTEHRQPLTLDEIAKWIDCYKFTHPRCESVSVKVWFNDLNNQPN